MANSLTEINANNLCSYFNDLQADALDRKGASLRYSIWMDLRYRLWRLCDEDFSEAVAAVRSLLDRYDETRATEATQDQERAEKQTSPLQQRQLMRRDSE